MFVEQRLNRRQRKMWRKSQLRADSIYWFSLALAITGSLAVTK